MTAGPWHPWLVAAGILFVLALAGHALWLTLRSRRWATRHRLWDLHRTLRAREDVCWNVNRYDALRAAMHITVERAKQEPSRLMQVLYPTADGEGIAFTVDRLAFRRDLQLVREEVAESEWVPA